MNSMTSICPNSISIPGCYYCFIWIPVVYKRESMVISYYWCYPGHALHRHAHDQQLQITQMFCVWQKQNLYQINTQVILLKYCTTLNFATTTNAMASFKAFHCHKPHIEILKYNHNIGISLVEFKKASLLQDSIILLLAKT